MIKNPRIALHLRGMYNQYIDARPALKELGRLIVSEYEPKTRTTKQNAYYWGVVVKMLSEYTGHTSQECHTLLKKQLLPPKQIKVNGLIVDTEPDSHDMSMADWEKFTESARMQVQVWTGERVPLPNEPPPEAYDD